MPAPDPAIVKTISWGLVFGWAALVQAAAPAHIVIPREVPKQRQAAAAILQEYIEKGTGTRLPISHEVGEGSCLHLGRSDYVDKQNLRLVDLGPDGFVLKRVDDRNYVIAGGTEDGTEFGVYDFLERYVGVRWLFPGEEGVDIPRQNQLSAREEEIRSIPALFCRNLSGLSAGAPLEWARRNRMRLGIEFHHNLYRLFPPSRYAKTHPEFYPLIEGKRLIPANNDDRSWQPNFSAPDLVEEAVRNIEKHFRDHPEAETFSLGVNDGNRYDESPESLARETGGVNFLGRRNVSNSYYRWCNDVVDRVLRRHPDKYFGCLAYSQVAEPPHFKLNPHIIPFLTYERLRWSDPKLRTMGEELTKRWHAVAPTLGWYDYAYGQDYCVPRVWPRLMSEYLRFGRDHGVRAMHSELYPNWAEGPKAYVFLRLQWNPDANVDALLDEWYERCVGEKAAPHLQEFYAIWERYWTSTAHHSPYWTYEGQYLDDSTPEYMNWIEPRDMERSRTLLNECVRLAGSEIQRKRAEILGRCFDYAETSERAYRPRNLAGTASIHSAEQAQHMALEVEASVMATLKRRELIEARRKDPVLSVGTSGIDRPLLRGDEWQADLSWRLLDWLGPGTACRATIERVRESSRSPARDNAAAVLAVADGVPEQVASNPSFETGLDPWRARIEQGKGEVRLVENVARTGHRSVVCEGIQFGGPSAEVKTAPGSYVAIARVMKPAGQESGGAALFAAPRGADGHMFWAPTLRIRIPAGEWVTVAYPFVVPAEQEGHRVDQVFLEVYATDLPPTGRLYIDDVCVYHLVDSIRPRTLIPF